MANGTDDGSPRATGADARHAGAGPRARRRHAGGRRAAPARGHLALPAASRGRAGRAGTPRRSGGAATGAVRELLDSWPGVYREDGRMVGFWGLALGQMPHRLYVDGRELRAWCAWDTLFLPELIGKPARVESSCSTTGQRVSLEVMPGQGVRDVSPEGAVLSFLRRDEPFAPTPSSASATSSTASPPRRQARRGWPSIRTRSCSRSMPASSSAGSQTRRRSARRWRPATAARAWLLGGAMLSVRRPAAGRRPSRAAR
jgi:hypothetical protein